MLERHAFPAPPNEIAQRRELCFCQLSLEFEVKLDPFPVKQMRQQMLRVQTRIVDLALL